MDFIWILIAFCCGFAFRLLSLPPLIGFLGAGFILNYAGFEPDASLQVLADLGITLMLFTVGLKLNIKDLLAPAVTVGTMGSMALWLALFSGLAMLAAVLGLSFFALVDWQTALLLAFALSFSSTVCIVKMLEESGEMKTRHGKLAIAILVMQDLIAVGFLVAATGKIPTIWALGLLLLIPLRGGLCRLLMAAGHGELLPLSGFLLALGGYELFQLVGVKGDLGALLMGVLLAGHPKSVELAKSLLGFKDLFLIGFFLSIGFVALPTTEILLLALLVCLLLPVKFLLFFGLLTKLRLRGRTAFLSGLALSNFSEFGLIVAALGVKQEWLHPDWLVVIAISVSISFIASSIAYRHAHSLYCRYCKVIRRFEHPERLPEDRFQQPTGAEVLVIGMGRVGKGCYGALQQVLGDKVCGVDADAERVKTLCADGKRIISGDAEDADFWENIDLEPIALMLLALPSVQDAIHIVDQLQRRGYQGNIAAIARYEDERELLLDSGINQVFNFYTEAGTGFAEESLQLLRGAQAAT